MSINERIEKLITYYEKGSQVAFAKKTNTPTTTLNGIIGERKSDPKSAFLQRILESYPNVNSKWLLTGDGEMTNYKSITSQIAENEKPSTKPDNELTGKSIFVLQMQMKDREREIKKLNDRIDLLETLIMRTIERNGVLESQIRQNEANKEE